MKRTLIRVLAGGIVLMCFVLAPLLHFGMEVCSIALVCGDGHTVWCSAAGNGANCHADAGTVTCSTDATGPLTVECPQAV